ncbi:MAG: rhomboid family intramembrane serine protease [Candidatus Nanopelagicales bacterium]
MSEEVFETSYCVNHPAVATRISCNRCSNPICPACMIPAAVGFQCPSCAKDSQVIITPRSTNRYLNRQASTWTKRLVIFISGIYLLQLLSQTLVARNWAVFMFGMHPPAVANGDWWRLITATFLHGSLIHLGFNMLALWILGTQIERFIGSSKFLVLYFASALGGSLFSFYFSPPTTFSIGASGAVFGLMGAFVVIGKKVNADVSQILVLLFINLVLGFTLSGIDWRAHLGGLITGVIVTRLLLTPFGRKDKSNH